MSADDAAKTLADACHAAYKKYPNSCSHSVWHVITSLADKDKKYQVANDLVDTLAKTWTEVDLATAAKLANAGEVVVGGQKAKGNGHVIIVFPGVSKPRGGYSAKDSAGKSFNVRSAGLYPLAMSTSIGSWAGAMSDGDKTVWDPWGTDKGFAGVKFWHKESGTAKTTSAKAASARKVLNDHNGNNPPANPISRYFA